MEIQGNDKSKGGCSRGERWRRATSRRPCSPRRRRPATLRVGNQQVSVASTNVTPTSPSLSGRPRRHPLSRRLVRSPQRHTPRSRSRNPSGPSAAQESRGSRQPARNSPARRHPPRRRRPFRSSFISQSFAFGVSPDHRPGRTTSDRDPGASCIGFAPIINLSRRPGQSNRPAD